MLNINLLPESQKEKIKSKRTYLVISSLIIPGIILILGIVVVLLFMIQYLSSTNNSLNDNINQLEAEKDKFSQTIEIVNDYNKNIDLSKQILDYQIFWSAILIDLAHQTPNQIKITDFNFNVEEGNLITIRGESGSKRAVILFKTKLDEAKYFHNAIFKEVNEENFEITCELNNINFPAGAFSSTAQKSSNEPINE